MSERPRAGYPGEQRAWQEPSLATATREGGGVARSARRRRRQERMR